MSHKAKELHNALEKLQNIPANKKCADCTKTITQRWAIFPWAVFICSECAAVHRRMGTHISKTKCISLDTLSEEEVELLKSIGNKIGNTYYEAKLNKAKPTLTSEHFLREKYEKKMFMAKGAEQGAKAIIEGRVEAVASAPQQATAVEETRTVSASTASSNVMVKKPAPTISTTPVQKKHVSSAGLADDFMTFSPTSTSSASQATAASSGGKQEKEEANRAILSLFDAPVAPAPTAAPPQMVGYPQRLQQVGIPMQPVYRPVYVAPGAIPPAYVYRPPTAGNPAWNQNTR